MSTSTCTSDLHRQLEEAGYGAFSSDDETSAAPVKQRRKKKSRSKSLSKYDDLSSDELGACMEQEADTAFGNVQGTARMPARRQQGRQRKEQSRDAAPQQSRAAQQQQAHTAPPLDACCEEDSCAAAAEEEEEEEEEEEDAPEHGLRGVSERLVKGGQLCLHMDCRMHLYAADVGCQQRVMQRVLGGSLLHARLQMDCAAAAAAAACAAAFAPGSCVYAASIARSACR
jgi:hypothetical protein